MALSEVFKALADPTRRQILHRLKQRPLTAGEIADGLTMSKPSVSNHLNILKAADLVACERSGQFMVYSLNATAFEEAAAAMFDFFSLTEAGGEQERSQP